MGDFRGADGGQVAVALVGEDDVVRIDPLAAGGDGGRAAVGRFHHIAVEVVIGKDSAADRRDADGFFLHAELVNRFGYETMDDAVGAAGAVMQGLIGQQLCFLIHNSHAYFPSFASVSTWVMISRTVGTMPPVRPKK